jgi:hypothetical protein
MCHDPKTPAPAGPGAILSASDDAGTPQGITMAASGAPASVGGLNVTATLGTYPVLQVASAPQPVVMLTGTALFILAAGWASLTKRQADLT